MLCTGRVRGRTIATAVALAVACLGGCSAQLPAGRPGHSRPEAVRRTSAASRYLVIARAGNRRLEVDFDRLTDHDGERLSASRADLRDAAATERLFDRRLRQIVFPAPIERTARRLYRINQSRAALTATAATAAASLAVLHADEAVLTAVNRPVEGAVRTIRRQLGLPPPSSS